MLKFKKQCSSVPSKRLENGTIPQQTRDHQTVSSNQEIEMEITGDMLEFIAHSMKHKKERSNNFFLIILILIMLTYFLLCNQR